MNIEGMNNATKKSPDLHQVTFSLEQGTGVEPASKAWEAFVLPIY